jgi:hypothetical protein
MPAPAGAHAPIAVGLKELPGASFAFAAGFARSERHAIGTFWRKASPIAIADIAGLPVSGA